MDASSLISSIGAAISATAAGFVLWDRWYQQPMAWFELVGLRHANPSSLEKYLAPPLPGRDPDVLMTLLNVGTAPARRVDVDVVGADRVLVFTEDSQDRNRSVPRNHSTIEIGELVGVAVWYSQPAPADHHLVVWWASGTARLRRYYGQGLAMIGERGSRRTRVATPRAFPKSSESAPEFLVSPRPHLWEVRRLWAWLHHQPAWDETCPPYRSPQALAPMWESPAEAEDETDQSDSQPRHETDATPTNRQQRRKHKKRKQRQRSR